MKKNLILITLIAISFSLYAELPRPCRVEMGKIDKFAELPKPCTIGVVNFEKFAELPRPCCF